MNKSQLQSMRIQPVMCNLGNFVPFEPCRVLDLNEAQFARIRIEVRDIIS